VLIHPIEIENKYKEKKMKYNLEGINGNAFVIMGYVTNAMKKEKKSEDEIKAYRERAMSSDYQNLLCESMDIIDELNHE